MPFSDRYLPIDKECPRCGDCARVILQTVSLLIRDLELRCVCRRCDHSFSRPYELAPHNASSCCLASGQVISLSSFPCSSGCETLAHVTRLEAGTRFIHCSFVCPTCRCSLSRYFDIAQSGFVLMPTVLRGSGLPIGAESGLFRGQHPFEEDGCTLYTRPADRSLREASGG